MKKIFSFMAIASTVLALASCKKDNSPAGPVKPDQPDEPEYVAPITIDGQFDDWAKLDASKVATATCEEGAAKEALKLVKVYADELYVFIYFEWDKELVEFGPEEFIPFHVYINGDGDASTGGFSDQFTDACIDLLMEGFLADGGEAIGSYAPSCFSWSGEPNGSGWSWADVDSGDGLCEGAGVIGKYEMAITRELYPLGKLADNFSIGFDIQQAWDSVGILPNSAEGTAESLKVTTVKAAKK